MSRILTRVSPSVCLASALVLLTAASDARGAFLTVADTANIQGAGHLTAPNPGGGSGGTLPPSFSFTPDSGFVLQVTSVVGTTSLTPGFDSVNGEGSTALPMNVSSFGGISGIVHTNRSGFLVGVFLDGTEPVAGTEPARLSFSNPEDFTTLAPLLRQTFFIGDGKTDTGGIVQSFIAPVGASRVFFGFVDAFFYTGLPGQFQDNSGRSLSVTFNDPIEPVASVPEPSSLVLLSVGSLGLIGAARTKRKPSTSAA